jgi:hypothetical protein
MQKIKHRHYTSKLKTIKGLQTNKQLQNFIIPNNMPATVIAGLYSIGCISLKLPNYKNNCSNCKNKSFYCYTCIKTHAIKAAKPKTLHKLNFTMPIIKQFIQAFNKGLLCTIAQGNNGLFISNNLYNQVNTVINKRYNHLSNFYYKFCLYYRLV